MKGLYYFNKQWKLVTDKGYTDMYLSELHYGEIPETKEMTFQDFQFAIDSFAKHNVQPEVRYTLFKKKPYLFFNIDGGLSYYAMTKRKFKPFILRWHYRKCKRTYSFHSLMRELPAHEFIDYCKDNGLSVSMEK